MDESFFDLIVELEKDLALFYHKVKSVSRFRPFIETFSLMATVSENHSNRIKGIDSKYTKPTFNKKAVKNLHNRIKDKLWDEITVETDENSIIGKMANSEEQIGDLYKAISEFLGLLGSYYLEISNEIENISGEEYGHRDALLKLIK